MDSNAVASVLFAAKMRSKSDIEQQRIAAQFSGDFFKEVLPIMYDASIIDKARFLALMKCGDVQGSLTTKELLELAIYWKITPTAAEFWKRNKSREELLRALQRCKETQEMADRMKAAMTLQTHAESASQASVAGNPRGRRSSLMGITQLFATPHEEHTGDLFGTHGEYTDGIIYMARRLRMDSASAGLLRAKIQAVNEVVASVRSGRRVDEEDKDDEIVEGVSQSDDLFNMMDDELQKPQPSNNTEWLDGRPDLSPVGSEAMLVHSPKWQPDDKLDMIAEDVSVHEADNFTLPPTLASSTQSNFDEEEPPMRVVGTDGHLHRIGSNRFNLSAYSTSTSPDKPDKALNKLLARGESFIATPAGLAAMMTRKPSFANKAVMDMETFIAKHSQADTAEEDGNLLSYKRSAANSRPSSRTDMRNSLGEIMDVSSPDRREDSPNQWTGSPQGSSANLGAEALFTGALEDGGMPEKLSKLDLYFRPVRDSDKVVLTMTPNRNRMRTATANTDALDNLIKNSHPATPLDSHRPIHTPSRQSNTVPPSPYSVEEDTVALRHRLGGRAGILARTISEKIRGEISTADIHLSPTFHGEGEFFGTRTSTPLKSTRSRGPPTLATESGFVFNETAGSVQKDPTSPRPRTETANSRRLQTIGSVSSYTVASEQPPLNLPAISVDPLDGGLGTVIAGLIDASKSKSSGSHSGTGTISRDVQYDAIVKQVNKLRNDKMKQDSNEKLLRTYGASSPAIARSPGVSAPSSFAR